MPTAKNYSYLKLDNRRINLFKRHKPSPKYVPKYDFIVCRCGMCQCEPNYSHDKNCYGIDVKTETTCAGLHIDVEGFTCFLIDVYTLLDINNEKPDSFALLHGCEKGDRVIETWEEAIRQFNEASVQLNIRASLTVIPMGVLRDDFVILINTQLFV